MSDKTLVEIIVDDEHKLTAQFEDNATTRSLISRMPFTIEMDNLYAREMCHRFGHGGLPVDNAQDRGYQVGDISYWPPMGSLVFLYEQNGEVFEQQPIGHIDNSINFFSGMNTAKVTFNLKR